MEFVSMKTFSKEQRAQLLEALGYSTDGKFVLDSEGKHVVDPYVDEDVTLFNMLILPGSTVILDNNPLSIISYLEDHPNAFA